MKSLIGTVISTKMAKTTVVKVDRSWRHPIYKKSVKRSQKYLVEDELNVKEGDKVKIVESRPLSKKKRFKIAEVLK